jgi:hypothetical protein
MIGFAIGNGYSRKTPIDFDLESLRGKGTTCGCNSLYNDFVPDAIVALDSPMIAKINKMERRPFRFITRDVRRGMMVDGTTVLKRPEINNYFDNLSGIFATVYLAKVIQCKEVYLIGFDFFLEAFDVYVDGYARNDIYAGYSDRPLKKGPTIAMAFRIIAQESPKTKFYRAGPIPEEAEEFFATELKGWTCIGFDELPP